MRELLTISIFCAIVYDCQFLERLFPFALLREMSELNGDLC